LSRSYAGPVLIDALAAMAVFAAIGAIAGRVADQLVQKSLESQFRKRVDRYRQDWIDAGRIRDESGHQALNE
jgi:hypothetical protein